ncbi:unnamed protein product [Auanema sp. JU1783]|nr:unnamed protein product [Auanema sp. JU1783]
MRESLLLILILLFIPFSSSEVLKEKRKILVISVNIAKSQTVYNARISTLLAKAGHDVTLLAINPFEEEDTTVKVDPIVKVKKMEARSGYTQASLNERQSEFIYKDMSIFNVQAVRHSMTLFSGFLQKICEALVQNKEVLDWLKAEKYDLAFVYMYHPCPIGIVHYAEIPTWIWLNSGMLMDQIAHIVGVPTVPSYVPTMIMEAQDKMNFFERTKSFMGHTLVNLLFDRMMTNPETEFWRKHVDPNFPHIADLSKECPLVMVNSNDLYQLPRPTLAKVINIGGIGMQIKDGKPLPKDMDELFQKAKGVIYFSFGSVAPAHLMPESWKISILQVVSRLPNYQFIMRYEKDDLNDRLPQNLKLFKWVPQTDILQHPKTKAFITHGGYNSLQETIAAGKPMLAVPLFGDQPKNAMIAKKHGIAVVISKSQIDNPDVLERGLLEIINSPSYAEKALRLREMVRHQPISPEELLIRWTEFTAEFKTLENLVPAGLELNFFQYYSLDSIAFLLSILLVSLYISYKIFRFILSFCFSKPSKYKKE